VVNTAHAIRGACGAPIRRDKDPSGSDSDHCVLLEGSASGTCAVLALSEEHGRKTQDAESARGSEKRAPRGGLAG